MTDEDRKQTLKMLKKGIRGFAKVLAQKELAFKHEKNMMKAFAPLTRELLKMEKQKMKLKKKKRSL